MMKFAFFCQLPARLARWILKLTVLAGQTGYLPIANLLLE
jgi:hypothetical protein